MTDQPINEAVKAYLRGKSLPTSSFAELNRMAVKDRRSSLPGPTAKVGIRRYYPAITAALVAVPVTMVVAWLMLQPRISSLPAVTIYQSIADEVATNHMKLKPLEVSSDNMSEVRNFFSSLGFTLIESAMFENTRWQITGGRFCTIQGEAAAQLRMRGAQGRIKTIYQVPYDPALHQDLPDLIQGKPPMKLYSRGLEVRLWRERGLLIATVSQ